MRNLILPACGDPKCQGCAFCANEAEGALDRALIRPRILPPYHPDLYSWSLSNVFWAVVHGFQLWGVFFWLFLMFLAATAYSSPEAAHSLALWTMVMGFTTLVAMVFAVVIQITNGERW